MSDQQQDSSLYLDSASTSGSTTGDSGKPVIGATLIYPGARISIEESVYATISFCQSEHISGAGLGRLLSLVEMHCPAKNKLLKTDHTFFQQLESVDTTFRVVHYCSICFKFRASAIDQCDSCTDPKRSKVDYFVQLPLQRQIAKLYARPGFVEKLKHKKTALRKIRKIMRTFMMGNCISRRRNLSPLMI